jgi:hypothetical protein
MSDLGVLTVLRDYPEVSHRLISYLKELNESDYWEKKRQAAANPVIKNKKFPNKQTERKVIDSKIYKKCSACHDWLQDTREFFYTPNLGICKECRRKEEKRKRIKREAEKSGN